METTTKLTWADDRVEQAGEHKGHNKSIILVKEMPNKNVLGSSRWRH